MSGLILRIVFVSCSTANLQEEMRLKHSDNNVNEALIGARARSLLVSKDDKRAPSY